MTFRNHAFRGHSEYKICVLFHAEQTTLLTRPQTKKKYHVRPLKSPQTAIVRASIRIMYWGFEMMACSSSVLKFHKFTGRRH